MHTKISSLAVGLALLLCSAGAQAFRCGNLLVREGDYTFDVLQKCGPPFYRDERTEVRGIRLKGIGLEQNQYDQVKIDEWVYNFGPGMFMQRLLFENGRLVEIRQLGYGR